MTSLMRQIIAWFGWGDSIGGLAGISAILTLAVIIAPVVAGMLLYGLERLQVVILKQVNCDFAYFFVNFITFPGTFVHEMAHLGFAVITGAEVHEICMFESGEGRLGHISYRNRGPWFIKAVQESLISVAPTVVCVVLGYIFLRMIFSGSHSTGVNIVLWYLVVSLVDHATMSDVDLTGYFSGVWIFVVPLFVFFMVLGLVA